MKRRRRDEPEEREEALVKVTLNRQTDRETDRITYLDR